MQMNEKTGPKHVHEEKYKFVSFMEIISEKLETSTDASLLMLNKVLPVKRMAAANTRFPRGFLLITCWDSHSSVCPLWQVRTINSMLPAIGQ